MSNVLVINNDCSGFMSACLSQTFCSNKTVCVLDFWEMPEDMQSSEFTVSYYYCCCYYFK